MARTAQAADAVEKHRPDYVVRAPDPNTRRNEPPRWLNVGVAWERTLKDGQVGISVKLNTVPVGSGWDGTLFLLPPLEREETNGDEGA